MTNENMTNEKINIIYFGSDDFSARVLEKLLVENTVQTCAVITKYPTKVGRGLVETLNPVEQVAVKNGIKVLNVKSLLKNPSQITPDLFKNIDFAVVVSFGYILPDEILNYLKDKFINLHVSLLPKYRGACPMEQTIVNQDNVTGSTIMVLNSGVDTGNILSQIDIVLIPDETIFTLESKIIEQGVPQMVQTLIDYKQLKITPFAQDETNASYTKKIEKTDGFITLLENPSSIYAKYRAYLKWPGIYSTIQNLETFLNIKTKIQNKSDFIKIAKCQLNGEGKLQILEIILPGKKAMNVKDFENGYKLAAS